MKRIQRAGRCWFKSIAERAGKLFGRGGQLIVGVDEEVEAVALRELVIQLAGVHVAVELLRADHLKIIGLASPLEGLGH